MAVKDVDGYPTVNTANGGLVLTVFPPEGHGKKLAFDNARREIDKYHVGAAVKWDVVRQIVDKASGKPFILIPPKSQSGDSQIFVQVSEDEMEATLTVLPPEKGGKVATVDSIREAIGMAGVKFGVLEAELTKIQPTLAKMAVPDQVFEPIETVIAKGRAVANGANATLDLVFEKKAAPAEAKPEDPGDGKADYRQVHTIQNVAKGDLIVKKVPATPGVPGMTVTGKDIPAKPGDDLKVAASTGAIVDPADPNSFLADADGQVVIKDNKISVLALYEIKGDLTMAIGNIDFVGTVVIGGSVGSGFKIKCGADLVVNGVLDSSEVQAGGKVNIKGGVVGQLARIVAEGDINAKYIRNAHVESGHDIVVNDAIMHANVIAAEKVQIVGAKGLLVGGNTIAGVEVSAKEMGAKMSTPTAIEVGENPRLREESQRVDHELKGLEEQLDKAKKGIAFLKDMSQKLGDKMPADKKEMLSKLTRTQFKLMGDLKPLQERKSKIAAQENEMKTTKRGKVNCMGIIYPGVKITVAKAARSISEELKYSTLVEDDGEIKVLPYSK
jgi:uncharacterized protein (DUF342 family)